MDLDLGKFMIALVGMLVGAFLGAWAWGQHVVAGVKQSVACGEDEALMHTLHTGAATSFTAGIHGAFVGGVIGLLLGVAYLYFSDPDRGMRIRKVHTGDDNY